MASSTAGSASSNRSAQIWESRSTPSISCVRSLLPIETPAIPMVAYSGIQKATEGTSAITQTGERSGQWAGVDHLEAGLELPGRAHEGDHEHDVRRLLEHLGQHVELEAEQVGLAHVAVAAAVADHGVLLLRLEPLAALEVAELVGPEVDAAVDDRPGLECPGDAQQRGRHGVDEGLLLAASSSRRGWTPPRASVTMNSARSRPTPSTRSGRHLFGVLGEGQVHVDAGGERPFGRPAGAPRGRARRRHFGAGWRTHGSFVRPCPARRRP